LIFIVSRDYAFENVICSATPAGDPLHASGAYLTKFVSPSECVGRFWLWESSQVVIQGNFHSLVGAKAVGSSGNHSNFVVESFDGAAGDLSFGSKPIQDEGLMSAQHAGHLFHRFQTAPHRAVAPIVEKGSCPDYGSVLPEVGKSLFQLPGPRGGQLAGQQGVEFLGGSPAYPAGAAEQGPADMVEPLAGFLTF